jgi:hypothetical protein
MAGISWTQLAVLAIALLTIAGAFAWARFRKRPSPEEVERRRRIGIYATGKVKSGQLLDVVIDAGSALLVYSYVVAGVEYHTSQDVSVLRESLPPEPLQALGPVAVRFDPRNPANSIVLCEEWSGLGRLHTGTSGQR